MAIELVCSCGRKLRFDQPPPSGTARCPSCGVLHTIGTGHSVVAADPQSRTTAGDSPPATPKALWALMGKPSAPAPAPRAEEPASAEQSPPALGDPIGTTAEAAAPPAAAPDSGAARKGLWSLMQASPPAPAAAAPESPPESEIVTEPPADDLAALIGVHLDSAGPAASAASARIRRGRSIKALVAALLGGLSIPISFLALIDELWARFPGTLMGFAALLLAIQAASEIQHSAGRQTGRKLVVAGIVTGIIGVFLGPLILAGFGRRM